MSHFIPVIAAVVLCLAAAFIVSWDLAPLILKPRRGPAGLPAIDPAVPAYLRAGRAAGKLRARVVTDLALPDGTAPGPAPGAVPLAAPEPVTRAVHSALHALGDATRDDLAVTGWPIPRCEYRGTQPRKTVHVIVCDPAVTPVVPRYYRAWLEGRFLP